MAVKLFLCITCLNIYAVNPVFINFEFMCNLLFIKWLNTDCILCRINERTVFIAYRPFNIKVISTVRLRVNRIYCIINIRAKLYFLALKKYITYMLFRISSNIYTTYIRQLRPEVQYSLIAEIVTSPPLEYPIDLL